MTLYHGPGSIDEAAVEALCKEALRRLGDRVAKMSRPNPVFADWITELDANPAGGHTAELP